jgi:twitching motility protein PilT
MIVTKISDLLRIAIQKHASDLHMVVGYNPIVRIEGVLNRINEYPILTNDDLKAMIEETMTPEQRELYVSNKELDYSYRLDDWRFRVNAYTQQGTCAVDFRLIPSQIKSIEELFLPSICHKFVDLPQGLVLIAGPTGHGKTTTIASIIQEINTIHKKNIITIEDPVEYIFPKGLSMISQREILWDTLSWRKALKSILREDPDVVLIGEMRDYETIGSAITIAETGHLVFATLHTNSAAQTVDRIVDVFPADQQAQIRLQLSNVLEAIVSIRLVTGLEGGRVPACEILTGTSAVRSTIREGKTHQINNIIQTSAEYSMISLEKYLAQLVMSSKISLETAKKWTLNPAELEDFIGSKSIVKF